MRPQQIIYILLLILLASCTNNSNPLPSVNEAVSFPINSTDKKTDRNIRPSFLLSPGNEVIINVWRNDDLGKTLKIDPTGNIDMPLIGTIMAAGLTVSQLRTDITSRLATYVKNPRVDINVSESSMQRHVLGEVNSPGSISIDSTITVWEAISRLGGFTDNANTDYILIARSDGENIQVNAITMDIETILNNGGISNQYYLQDGDILFVSETMISSIESFMNRLNNIIRPIVTLQQAFILMPEAISVIENGFATSEDTSIIVTPN